MLQEALLNLASNDHYIRLMSSEILYEADKSFSSYIIDIILCIDSEHYKIDNARSIFRVVSGTKDIEPEKIFQFLEQWPWPDGIKSALKDIFKYLTNRDTKAIKKWLLEKIDTKDIQFTEKILTAFNIIAQENIEIFNRTDLRMLYNTSFNSSKSTKVAFAKVAGCIAKIDKNLAEEILLSAFKEGKDCQTAAINSLEHCLDSCPEFILDQGCRIINLSSSTKHFGFLHCFLGILKNYPKQESHNLLIYLNNWFTQQYLQTIKDEKAITEILAILKVFAKENPGLVLDISDRCLLVSKGVAGALSALYNNITEHSDDIEILTRVLNHLSKIWHFSQVRIGNALQRALPCLDQKLGDRKVIDMIFRSYKGIQDKQALQELIRAALEIHNWNEKDTKALLQDPELPGEVRGILLAKRKRNY